MSTTDTSAPDTSAKDQPQRTPEPGVLSRLALVAATTWRATTLAAAFVWWLMRREAHKGPRRILAWLAVLVAAIAAPLIAWGPPVTFLPSVIAVAVSAVVFVGVVRPLRKGAYFALRWAGRQIGRGVVVLTGLALAGLLFALVWTAKRPRFIWGVVHRATKSGVTGEVPTE